MISWQNEAAFSAARARAYEADALTAWSEADRIDAACLMPSDALRVHAVIRQERACADWVRAILALIGGAS